VPKPTLLRWATTAGVTTEHSDPERTRRAVETRVARVEETKAELVELLSAVATVGARLELSMLRPGHELADPALLVYYDDEEGVSRPYAAGRLDQIVGARTRAIHDLNLLTGQATSNAAVIVRFEVPRPDPKAADAGAIDEADVGMPELGAGYRNAEADDEATG
jgi:hypothetical protein